jgi:hypothetical protein
MWECFIFWNFVGKLKFLRRNLNQNEALKFATAVRKTIALGVLGKHRQKHDRLRLIFSAATASLARIIHQRFGTAVRRRVDGRRRRRVLTGLEAFG